MAKPIIKEIIPFDANYPYTVEFSWTGDMAYNNQIIIYDAETLVPLYEHVYEDRHYQLNHEIPAYVLQNGGKYAVTISVINMHGDVSSTSDKYYFLTLETPLFFFNNVVPDQQIENAIYTVEVEYHQANDEPLASYQFQLYNDVRSLVYESDILYDIYHLTYTYKDLANTSDYYFRATGVTKKGLSVDTGMIHVTTYYQDPNVYARIYADNDDMTGFIHYFSNIVVLEPDDDDYELEDSYVNLTTKPIRYTKDYTIPRDATIAIRLKDANKETEFLRCQDGDNPVFSLYTLQQDDENHSLRFALRVFGEASDYVQYSDPIVIKSWDIVTVYIRRINGLYAMFVHVDNQDPMMKRNLWLQEENPMGAERTDLWLNTNYGVYIAKDDVEQYYQDEQPENFGTYTIWIGGADA